MIHMKRREGTGLGISTIHLHMLWRLCDKHHRDRRVITLCTKTLWRHCRFGIPRVTPPKAPLLCAYPFVKFLDKDAIGQNRAIHYIPQSTCNLQRILRNDCFITIWSVLYRSNGHKTENRNTQKKKKTMHAGEIRYDKLHKTAIKIWSKVNFTNQKSHALLLVKYEIPTRQAITVTHF
jgi:hypothetical protein